MHYICVYLFACIGDSPGARGLPTLSATRTVLVGIRDQRSTFEMAIELLKTAIGIHPVMSWHNQRLHGPIFDALYIDL